MNQAMPVRADVIYLGNDVSPNDPPLGSQCAMCRHLKLKTCHRGSQCHGSRRSQAVQTTIMMALRMHKENRALERKFGVTMPDLSEFGFDNRLRGHKFLLKPVKQLGVR